MFEHTASKKPFSNRDVELRLIIEELISHHGRTELTISAITKRSQASAG